eukprot:1438063-Prorocentrum_lima.AAC.1
MASSSSNEPRNRRRLTTTQGVDRQQSARTIQRWVRKQANDIKQGEHDLQVIFELTFKRPGEDPVAR